MHVFIMIKMVLPLDSRKTFLNTPLDRNISLFTKIVVVHYVDE